MKINKLILSTISFLLLFSMSLSFRTGQDGLEYEGAAVLEAAPNYGMISGVLKCGDGEQILRVGLRGTENYTWTDSFGRFKIGNLPLGTYHIEVYTKDRCILYDEIVELSVIFKDYELKRTFKCQCDHKESDVNFDKNFGQIYGTIRDTCSTADKRYRVGLSNTDVYVWTSMSGDFKIEDLPLDDYQVNIYDADTRQLIKVKQINLTKAFPRVPVHYYYCGADVNPGDVTPDAIKPIRSHQERPQGPGVIHGQMTLEGAKSHYFKVQACLDGSENYCWDIDTDADGNYELRELPLGSYTCHVYKDRTNVRTERVVLSKLFPRYYFAYIFPADVIVIQPPKPKAKGAVFGRIYDPKLTEQVFQVELEPLGTKMFVDKNTGDYRFNDLPSKRDYTLRVYDAVGKEITNQTIQLTDDYNNIRFDHQVKQEAPPKFIHPKIDFSENDDNSTTVFIGSPHGPKTPKTGSIRGTIKDEKKKTQDFQVELDPIGAKIFVDRHTGDFLFNNLPLKDYIIRVFDPAGKEITNQTIQLSKDYLDVRFDHFIKEEPKPREKGKKEGSVFGKVLAKEKPNKTFRVGLSGTDHFSWTDQITGEFNFNGLDFGHYQLVIFDEKQNVRKTLDIHLTTIFPTYKVDETIDLSKPVKPETFEADGSIVGHITRKGEKTHYYRVVIPGTNFVATTDANGNFEITGLKLDTYSVQVYDYNTQEHVGTYDVDLTRIFPRREVRAELPSRDSEADAPKKGSISGRVSYSGECKKETLNYRVYISGQGVSTALDGFFKMDKLPFDVHFIRVYDENHNLVAATEVQLSKDFPTYWYDVKVPCDPNDLKKKDQQPNGKGLVYGKIQFKKNCEKNPIFRIAVGDTSAATRPDGSFELGGLPFGNQIVMVYDPNQQVVDAREFKLSNVFPVYVFNPELECPQPKEPKKDGRAVIFGNIKLVENCKGDDTPHLFTVAVNDTAVTSLPDGSFEIRNLDYGNYMVRIYNADRDLIHSLDVPLTHIFPTYGITLTVDCKGQVKEKAKPKPGRITGKIVKKDAKDNFYRIRLAGTDRIVSTDISGNFEIANLDYGLYSVVVYDQNQLNVHNQEVELTKVFPVFFVDVKLESDKDKKTKDKGKIAGTIMTKEGENHSYRIVLAGNFPNGKEQFTWTNKEAGTFSFENLPFGSYYMAVYNEKQKQVHVQHIEIDELFPVYNMEVKIDADASAPASTKNKGKITGAITAKEGQNHSFRIVLAGNFPNGKEQFVWTNKESGTFAFEKLPFGSYHLAVYNEQQKQVYAQHIEIDEMFPVYHLKQEIKPEKGQGNSTGEGKIYGVLTTQGQDFHNFTVALSAGTDLDGKNVAESSYVTRTNKDGVFHFNDLPYGTYGIVVYEDGEYIYYKEVTLSSTFPVYYLEQAFEAAPYQYVNGDYLGPGIVKGKITYSGDANKLRVVAVAANNYYDRRIVTPDDKANYAIEGLPLGAYTIHVYEEPENIVYTSDIVLSDVYPVYTLNIKADAKSKEKGKALVYGRVLKKGAADGPYRVVMSGTTKAATTDRIDGTFEIKDVPHGSYVLSVLDMKDQKSLYKKEVLLSDIYNEYYLDIDLDTVDKPKPKDGRIYGFITDKDSKTNDFTVVLYGTNKNEKSQKTVPETGAYNFEGLAYDDYYLTVYDKKHGTVYSERIKLDKFLNERQIDYEHKKKKEEKKIGRIFGSVQISSSECPDVFTVVLRGVDLEKTQSNADGTFSFDGLKVGHYLLEVYNKARKKVFSEEIEITTIFPVKEIQKIYDESYCKGNYQPGSIIGRVIDVENQKPKDKRIFTVEIVGKDTFFSKKAEKFEGHFNFENLQLGDYILRVFDKERNLIEEGQVKLTKKEPRKMVTIRVGKTKDKEKDDDSRFYN